MLLSLASNQTINNDQRFKIATYCQFPKISNFGDNSLDNIRDKG